MRRKRGWLLAAALMMCVGLVAAGCGSSSEETSSASGGSAAEKELAPLTPVQSPDCHEPVTGAGGKGDVLVVVQQAESGFAKAQGEVIGGVMKAYLEQHDWKAGDFQVALQFCNDATPAAGFTDPAKCAQLANAYTGNQSVVAVVGYDSSTCLQTVLPTLNQAPGGPLPAMSTQATYVCFVTKSPTACKADEPEKYYPTGRHHFFSAVPSDNYTGSAFGQLMADEGYEKVYVLSHDQPYGKGLATLAAAAAKKLGIEVVKQETWDAKASSYRALMERVKASGADALVVSGYPADNTAQLMKDRAAVLGPNFPALLNSTYLETGFLEAAGSAGEGGHIIVESRPPDELDEESKAFFEQYVSDTGDDRLKTLGAYPTFGLATAQLFTAAIAGSDGTRAGVLEAFAKVETNTVYNEATGFTETGALRPPPPAAHFKIDAGGKSSYVGAIEYPSDLPDGL